MKRTLLSSLIFLAFAGLLSAQDGTEPAYRKWALTPPMGWNSWDCFGPTVEEHEVKANADYMAKYLKKYGWEYVVVDIRWFVENDKAGGYNQTDPRYVIDEFGRYQPAVNRFPSAEGNKGFKPLADYIHKKGLKFGIHIMRGIPKKAVEKKLPVKGTNGITADQIYTPDGQCPWLKDNYTIVATKSGAQEYYNSLFEMYAGWGVDFIKIDDLSRPYHKAEIELIRKAIDRCGRPIVLSLSPGETPFEEARHVSHHANMWRMVDDVWDKWEDVIHLLDVAQKWYPYIKPGTWPDCDMIPLGRISIRGERGQERMTQLTKDEQYSLMSFFSIFKSPLMFGGNLPDNDNFTLSLLTNKEVLYMHRHSVNNRQWYRHGETIAWIADDPATGDKFLALFFTGQNGSRNFQVDMSELGFTDKVKVRDMWRKKNLGFYSGTGFAPSINSHGVGLYRLSGKKKEITFRTICNPMDLSYRFCLGTDRSFREAADPSMVLYKGEYYLFLSKSGGYFHSTDMENWDLITTDDLPIEEYAPTVEEIDGTLFFTTSTGTKRVYKGIDPKQGKWELFMDKFPYAENDPMYFRDEDGKLYFYSGSSPDAPITGMELDPETMLPVTGFIPLLSANRKQYGWEVWGDYNTQDAENPWLEGAYMTKHNGKYYLQYSAPGTQFKSYADGVYVSQNPLGPFTLARHNPFAYKPEGFAAGAGHGSTFKDVYGNYWHIGTVALSVRHMFERRLSLFPTFFDKDGEMYAYTGWGDYPLIIPDKKISSPEELFPGWMLLSYNKAVKASSTLSGHPAEKAVNEDIRTWWSAETGNKGEYLSVDLGNRSKIYAIQINFGDQDAVLFGRNDTVYYQYYVEGSDDGANWKMLADKSDNKANAPSDYIQLDKPVTARYMRITNVRCPSGKFSISGFRIFGKMDKELPATVQNLRVARNQEDRRKANLNWDKVDGAVGYNVRFGSDKNKLYHNYIVYSDNAVSINILNTEQPYYFTVDSFNEAGITKGAKEKEAK
jgi:hypothetical protein